MTKKNILIDFASIFIDHFGERFDTNEQQFLIDIYVNKYFVAFHFIVGARRKERILYETKSGFDVVVNKIGYIKTNEVNRYVDQDIRGFTKNSFYLIKPNRAKNWRVDVAHRDLSHFVEAIFLSESKNLLKNKY